MRLSLLPYLSACLLYLFICLSFFSFVYHWLSITYLHSTSQKFLHSTLQGQLSLLIQTGMYKESWWRLLLVRVTFTQMRKKKKNAFACVHLCPSLGFKMKPELYDTEAPGFQGGKPWCLGQMSHFNFFFLFCYNLLKVSHKGYLNTLVSSCTKIIHMLVRLISTEEPEYSCQY